jgi:hypothetical protein
MSTPDAPPARVFDVQLPDVNADALEQRLRERAAARAGLSAGGTELDEIVRKFDLKSVRNEEEFLRFFMDRLQELHQVDINDFPIQSHRGLVGRPIRLLKSTLWKLLKFYTYRLFSQQNQINAQLAAALDALLRKSEDRIRKLEARIAELEGETHPAANKAKQPEQANGGD